MSQIGWIIAAAALATYVTRACGHLVLSRFQRIHPRVEAALNAVPAAVLTTLVAPVLVTGSWREILTLALATMAVLRLPGPVVFLGGWALIVGLRHFAP